MKATGKKRQKYDRGEEEKPNAKKKVIKETPDYKRVEGTRMVVDAFTTQSPNHSAYFLSHYHSDHYVGLRGAFKGPGPICYFFFIKYF